MFQKSWRSKIAWDVSWSQSWPKLARWESLSGNWRPSMWIQPLDSFWDYLKNTLTHPMLSAIFHLSVNLVFFCVWISTGYLFQPYGHAPTFKVCGHPRSWDQEGWSTVWSLQRSLGEGWSWQIRYWWVSWPECLLVKANTIPSQSLTNYPLSFSCDKVCQGCGIEDESGNLCVPFLASTAGRLTHT